MALASVILSDYSSLTTRVFIFHQLEESLSFSVKEIFGMTEKPASLYLGRNL